MMRVGSALVVHELLERARDRWVIIISVLFALMASGVTLYGRSAGDNAAMLTGPSLVTLASLFVPLVALVLGHDLICGERERNTLGLLLSLPATTGEIVTAKILGRLCALALSVSIGLGIAILLSDGGSRYALAYLIGPTLLLGAAFLTLGSFLSGVTRRPGTAASLAVAVWFLLVFFYDLGLLGLLVITDGAIPSSTVAALVAVNPAGLYRVEMMSAFSGITGLDEFGLGGISIGGGTSILIWGAWILGPPAITTGVLARRRSHR